MPNATNADGTPAVSCTCNVVGPSPEPPRRAAAPASAPACRDRQRAQRRDRRRPHRVPHLGASLLPLAPLLSATGGSDTLPGRDQRARDPLPRRLPPPPRDPHALEGQRRLRPRQQRRVLLVLRHRHQRVADRGGRPRHPRRPGDRPVRRVALRLPRAARVPRDRGGGAARRAPRALERALRDRAVPARAARSPRRRAGSSTCSSTASPAGRSRSRPAMRAALERLRPPA